MRLHRIFPALLLALASAAGAADVPASAEAKAALTQQTYMALIRELGAGDQPYAVLAHVASYESRWGASPETQLLRADALRATAQEAAAARAYRELLDGPRAAAAHHGLGLLAATAGELPRAIEHFTAAARLEPTDARLLGDLGFALLRAGRTEEARLPLMTAAQLAPRDSRTLANLASYFFARGQRAEAEAVLASPHVTEQARASVRAQAPEPAEPRLRLAATLSLPAAARGPSSGDSP